MKEQNIPIPVSYGLNTILCAAFLAAGNHILKSGLVNRAQSSVILQIGIFIILAVSLNVSTGYLGQLPLGHAGFMAVGGYAAAIFWRSGLLPQGTAHMILGLVVAGVVSAIFGIIIGIPALRLRGDYLAIITLGFGEIIRVAIINLSDLTGGTPGLKNIPKYASFSLVYICVILTCMAIYLLMKSRHGRAILSIRENEIAAEACGVKTTYYKVLAFAVSAFFAGIAGALYAANQGILVPSAFDFMMSINILVIVVLGGMGSMTGSIVAAAVITSLPLALQSFNRYRMIVYPILLVIVMIYRPRGLMGTYEFSLSRVLGRLFGGKAKVERTGGGER